MAQIPTIENPHVIVFECEVCGEIFQAEPLRSICGEIVEGCEADAREHEAECSGCIARERDALDD